MNFTPDLPSRQEENPALNQTYYTTTFLNPTLSMSIRKKHFIDSEYWKFIDFAAGIMFPVQPNNSVEMTEYQFHKCLEIIAVELRQFLREGFNPFAPSCEEQKLEIEPEQIEKVDFNDGDELIPMFKAKIGDEEINAVDAKELYRFLGVGDKFIQWINRRIKEYKFITNSDFFTILGKSSGGRIPTQYILSLDMAKELCMVERNAKGREARRYFIACEKKLREIERTVTGQLFPVATTDILKERDDAIRTKMQIGDKKVASALGRVGVLVQKNKRLELTNKCLSRQLQAEKNHSAQISTALDSAKKLLDDLSPVFKRE